MDADTMLDLANLHQAVEDAIKGAFPTLETVEFYREETDREPPAAADLPACLLDLEEMEPVPAEDPGTEQLAVYARFAARLVIEFRTPRAKLEIRKLAASFASFLRQRRWGLPVGPAEVLAIMPDDFSPELDRYEVWRVEWRQIIHLGATVWTDEGITTLTPLYGWSPEIGTGNESDYHEAAP